MTSETTRATAAAMLLGTVTGPDEVRRLDPGQLPALAAEIRTLLIDKVCRTGGHLGPNLGVVELTIALHRVFDSPQDKILFDTGHQAYVHKILTGRHKDFEWLRHAGGLSGYPCRAESEHDVIENSHASTALSYADGLAKGFALRGQHHRRVVAVVGDGALTGGMCWEALNNIGGAHRPVVIVLNDNGRSYAPTIGALADHLATLRQACPDRSRRWSHHPGPKVLPNLFEALGLTYLGPVDGHDTPALERALRHAAAQRRPVVVHCLTRKGEGYPPAEADEADHMHTVGASAARQVPTPTRLTWTDVFAEELRALGATRPDLVAITAAMLRATGLYPFAAAFPERVFDVGISEQHAVTSAAGLAMAGMHPVVAIYSAFLTRALDQLLMDVALHSLPVTFVCDRAGITGPDGASHHGMWDLSLLPVIPGLRITAPRDPVQLRALLREAIAATDGPNLLRFPKATADPEIPALRRIGHADVLHQSHGSTVLLVAVGVMAGPCLRAARRLEAASVAATVVDPRWLAPLDCALVDLAATHRLVVSVEDNTTAGGFGTRLAHALSHRMERPAVYCLGLPHSFLPHGARADLLRDHHLDADLITDTVLRQLASHREQETSS